MHIHFLSERNLHIHRSLNFLENGRPSFRIHSSWPLLVVYKKPAAEVDNLLVVAEVFVTFLVLLLLECLCIVALRVFIQETKVVIGHDVPGGAGGREEVGGRKIGSAGGIPDKFLAAVDVGFAYDPSM